MGGTLNIHFDVNLLKKAQKAALLKLFLSDSGEYHHVRVKKERGYFMEELYFYEISADKLNSVTERDIELEISFVSIINQEKREKQLANKARKLDKARLAAKTPLIIGMFSKRDYYYNKWQSSFTTFIGIIDGSHLYYYDLPKKKDDEAPSYSKEQLGAFKIRKTAWPYDESYQYKNIHTFKTFAAFVKKHPEYENKQTEIRQLKVFRKQERAKLKQ